MFAIHTQDPDAADRGRIAKGTAVVAGVGTLVSLANSLLSSESLAPETNAIFITLLIVSVIVFVLAHIGYVKTGAIMLTTTIFLGITVPSILEMGNVDPTRPTYILAILVAGLLLGSNAGLVVGALSLISMVVLQTVAQLPWSTISISNLATVGMATGLIWLTIRRQERALIRAHQQTQTALDNQQALIDQQTALQNANKDLLATNEQMNSLLTLVRDLETPVIPLLEGVLVMPLVGHVDTRRASQLTEAVLAAVHEQRARVVIIDITGVSVVDTAVAQRLGLLAQSVQLLGAHVLLTGIRADVAQTIVTQGIDFSNIQTAGRLQDGVAAVLNHEQEQHQGDNHHAGVSLN